MQLLPRHHLTRDELKHLIHQLDPRRKDYHIESQDTIARIWCFLHGHEFIRLTKADGLVYNTRHNALSAKNRGEQLTKDYHDEVLNLDEVLNIVERDNKGTYFEDLLPREPYRPVVTKIEYQIANEQPYFIAQLYAYRPRDVERLKTQTVYPHTTIAYGRTRYMAVLAAVLSHIEGSLAWDQMEAEDAAAALAKQG